MPRKRPIDSCLLAEHMAESAVQRPTACIFPKSRLYVSETVVRKFSSKHRFDHVEPHDEAWHVHQIQGLTCRQGRCISETVSYAMSHGAQLIRIAVSPSVLHRKSSASPIRPPWLRIREYNVKEYGSNVMPAIMAFAGLFYPKIHQASDRRGFIDRLQHLLRQTPTLVSSRMRSGSTDSHHAHQWSVKPAIEAGRANSRPPLHPIRATAAGLFASPHSNSAATETS